MANGKIDTGTGGFPLDDGNLHTYDVGVDDATSATLAAAQWSSGDVSVDTSRQDLPAPTKATLASYLSKTTLGKAGASPVSNRYPLDGEASPPIEVSLTDTKGYPVPPSEPKNTSQFVTNLPSGRSQVATTTNLPIVRGKQEPTSKASIDGNLLLRTAEAEVSPVKTYTSAILNNRFADQTNAGNDYRFSSDAKYEDYFVSNGPAGTAASEQLGKRQFAAKYKPGESSPAEGSLRLSFGQLAQVGPVLSLRAGYEKGSTQDGVNPNDLEGSSILPGTTQLGVQRINTDLLTAKDVISNLTDASINEVQLIKTSDVSWGTLNNVLDQFSGISNFGMQLLALALIAALGVIITAMSALFMIPSSDSQGSRLDSAGRYAYGSFDGRGTGSNYTSVGGIVRAILSGNFNFWQFIGVRPTYNPLARCLPRGALSFFNIEADGFVEALTQVDALAENPGYSAIMARSVSRSFLLIGDAMKGLIASFSSGNLTSGVKQLLGLVEVFRGSKFIGALNVFAQTGDRVLLSNTPVDPDANNGSGKKYSSIDSYSNYQAAHIKSRLAGGGLRLAWSAYRAPDNLIIPQGYFFHSALATANSEKELGVPSFLPTEEINSEWGLNSDASYKITRDGESRISTDDREKLEYALDGDFLPFYFHDVRTNEIISFHAFLTRLNDTYNSSYDSQDAFGRVEPVKVYKGTTRKLDLSFIVAALDQDDFNSMWLKVNKLITLLYPQYSEGKSVTSSDGNYRITLPFSQMISASPLVRLRIGDLVQSNYSKFNLARLFGYATKDSVIDGINSLGLVGENAGVTATGQLEIMDKILVKLKKSALTDPRYYFTDANHNLSFLDSSTAEATVGLQKPTHKPRSLPNGLLLQPVKPGKSDNASYFKVVVDDQIDADFAGKLIEDYGNPDRPEDYMIDSVYLVNHNNVVLTKKSLDDLTSAAIKEKIPSTASSYADSATNFMNDDANPPSGAGNAVVRSFRSIGGKGLAGFIDSMSFNWLDKVTWDGIGQNDFKGRRAPRMCEVTLSFSVVHDISPGLDNTGFNRAPLYPVGPFYTNVKKPKGT